MEMHGYLASEWEGEKAAGCVSLEEWERCRMESGTGRHQPTDGNKGHE